MPEPFDGPPAVAVPEPVADVVARHRADDADDQNDGQVQDPTGRRVAGHGEHCFLGNRQTHVAQDDGEEDPQVAPVVQ